MNDPDIGYITELVPQTFKLSTNIVPKMNGRFEARVRYKRNLIYVGKYSTQDKAVEMARNKILEMCDPGQYTGKFDYTSDFKRHGRPLGSTNSQAALRSGGLPASVESEWEMKARDSRRAILQKYRVNPRVAA